MTVVDRLAINMCPTVAFLFGVMVLVCWKSKNIRLVMFAIGLVDILTAFCTLLTGFVGDFAWLVTYSTVLGFGKGKAGLEIYYYYTACFQ